MASRFTRRPSKAPSIDIWRYGAFPGRHSRVNGGGSLDGCTVADLQQQIETNGRLLEGLSARMRRQEQMIMAENMADVERDIQRAAASIREARHVKPETAYALALQENPALYDRYNTAAAGGSATTSTSKALDLAVAVAMKANPTLTKEQAFALALQQNPSLYEG